MFWACRRCSKCQDDDICEVRSQIAASLALPSLQRFKDSTTSQCVTTNARPVPRTLILRADLTCPEEFPRSSAAKYRDQQIPASEEMIRCRPASIPPGSE